MPYSRHLQHHNISAKTQMVCTKAIFHRIMPVTCIFALGLIMNTKKNLRVQKRLTPSEVVNNSDAQSQPAEKSLTVNRRERSDIARRRVSRRSADASATQRNSKRTRGLSNESATLNVVPLAGENNAANRTRKASRAKTIAGIGVFGVFFARFKRWFLALGVGALFSALALKTMKLGRKKISFIAAGLALLIITPIIVSVALPNHNASANSDAGGSVTVAPKVDNATTQEDNAGGGIQTFNSSLSGASLDVQAPTAKEPEDTTTSTSTDGDASSVDIPSSEPSSPAIATGAPVTTPGVLTAAEVEAETPVVVNSAYPGFTHPIVAQMQEKLIALGYLGEDAPSEYYGPAMEDAIKLFQRMHGLSITGIADETTFALLLSEDAQKYMVSEGIEGDDVYALTERLVDLDYLAEATDVFDANVTAAVKRFQARNSLTQDGKIGAETREKIYGDGKANALSAGDASEEILGYQNRLYELGYLMVAPDSKYGEQTVAAVRRFQDVHGLTADGHLGKTSRELLMSAEAQSNSLGLGDNGDDVAKIQSRLVELGYMSSSTGHFGSSTEEALKTFQTRNGLSADGKVGTGTRDVLLSANAKKAPAPEPVVPKTNSSSTKNNSSSSKSNSSSSSSGNSGGGVKVTVSGANVESLLAVARSRKGCPYRLGAKGPSSFDCSGFVYWCLNQIGVKQGYMTSAGWRSAKYQRIEGMNNIQAGDIIVFNGHVGIAASGSTMIDASSSKNAIVERTFRSSYWDNKFICAYRIF